MINEQELINAVKESEIDEKLFEELLEGNIGIRKAFYSHDYEKTLIKGGKFAETLGQILEDIVEGEYSTSPNLSDVQEALRQTTRGEHPDSVRIILPRVAKAMYDFRSRRGGAHKAEISPQYIDAHAIVSLSKWTISELIRAYGDSDIEADKIEWMTHHLVSQNLPFVEEFEDGDVVLLIEAENNQEECLLLLYHFYPARISRKELAGYLDDRSAANIGMSIKRLSGKKLVHENDEGTMLTRKGKKKVEEKYGPELTVEESE